MAKASKSKLGASVGAAAIGVAIGGILGMLFAPKSGKQTRADIATKGRKVADAAKNLGKKPKTK